MPLDSATLACLIAFEPLISLCPGLIPSTQVSQVARPRYFAQHGGTVQGIAIIFDRGQQRLCSTDTYCQHPQIAFLLFTFYFLLFTFYFLLFAFAYSTESTQHVPVPYCLQIRLALASIKLPKFLPGLF
ncbi:hypothetical protein BKA59DRAFT_37974 [Fusarium tricinctum]|uniref:Uncharacterized protein n=1 Tax=Fusarium tricinctum TaxID=61284 RepID=A0A8K0WHU5_9HYPO|nr:hypothetical protein BKA59DRAFT_37974 [Fusarium tricinctum]